MRVGVRVAVGRGVLVRVGVFDGVSVGVAVGRSVAVKLAVGNGVHVKVSVGGSGVGEAGTVVGVELTTGVVVGGIVWLANSSTILVSVM